jgi:transcriptional regulator with XRE-family HTH domain
MKLVVEDEAGNRIPLPNEKDIAKFIAKGRKEKGMSLQAVADVIGVKRQAVWSWEKGKSLPLSDHLMTLVKLFGTPETSVEVPDTKAKSRDDMNATLDEVEALLGA